MEHATLRNVTDLQGDKRTVLEGLLGQQLSENQQVFIMVFTPGVIPDDEVRQAAATRIEKALDESERQASARAVTAEEADAAVDEAIDHVRYRQP
jgi:hypothetical protein